MSMFVYLRPSQLLQAETQRRPYLRHVHRSVLHPVLHSHLNISSNLLCATGMSVVFGNNCPPTSFQPHSDGPIPDTSPAHSCIWENTLKLRFLAALWAYTLPLLHSNPFLSYYLMISSLGVFLLSLNLCKLMVFCILHDHI